jgi:hypothetical protein
MSDKPTEPTEEDIRYPWDRPQLARRGSAERVLYEAIGRTLMAWEEVEGACAHLYSAFIAGWRFSVEANRE